MSTVGQALDQWFAARQVRATTARFHRDLARAFRAAWPALEVQAAEASTDQVNAFLSAISHFSAPRFNALVNILRTIIPIASQARRRRVPLSPVELPTPAQFRALLQALDRSPKKFAGLFVRFLAYTGLRVGEASRLAWSDVQADCLLVPAALTKNGRPRAVPLVPGLPGILEQLRAVSPGPRILPQRSCRKAMAVACAAVGIRRLTHHDLRHLFATRCIECGVDVPTVARWLGHLDGGTLLMRRYFHLLDEHGRRMALRVAI